METSTARQIGGFDRSGDAVARGFDHAYAIARQFYGATTPNPPVGCVVLDADGHVIGAGAHERAGRAHAEVNAIEAARAAGRFGDIHTLIVTLEPCNHFGRTPPCSLAILETPARDIWIGQRDSNPHVAGSGAQRLAAAGRNVRFLDGLNHPEAGRLLEQTSALVAPFEKLHTTGLPFIVVKQAFDRHHSMIPPRGAKTFTSPASLKLAHLVRKRSDAIITGSGTVLADQPAFTVRHVPDFAGKQRTLVILDRRGRVDADYATRAEAAGFDVWRRTDLDDALAELGQTGHAQVLVEAGPVLSSAVLAGAKWDLHLRVDHAPPAPDRVTVARRSGGPINHQEWPCFQE